MTHTISKDQKPWRKGTFKVSLGFCGAETSTPEREGIIHPSGFFAIEKGCGRVTHLPTGLFISPWLTPKKAKEFANRIAPMSDEWGMLTNENGSEFRIKGRTLREVILTLQEDLLRP